MDTAVKIDVTTIPKTSHRYIVGAKGATLKALQEAFTGCVIKVPDPKLTHSDILVTGPSDTVKKCIATMEALVSASGDTACIPKPASPSKAAANAPSKAAANAPSKAAANAPSKAAANAPPPSQQQLPSSSSAAVATAPATTLLTFSFEKSAHAKLRGPRDAKKLEVEKQLMAALCVAGGPSVNISRVSVVIPPSSDITAETITVEAVVEQKGDADDEKTASPQLSSAALDTLATFLKSYKMERHVRDDAMTAAMAGEGAAEKKRAPAARPTHSNQHQSHPSSATKASETHEITKYTNGAKTVQCYNCGKNGHLGIECTTAPASSSGPTEIKLTGGSVMKEVYGDLMTAPDSLCHCVSECMAMGAGIAVLFKQGFGRVDELKAQNVKVGGVAVLDVTAKDAPANDAPAKDAAAKNAKAKGAPAEDAPAEDATANAKAKDAAAKNAKAKGAPAEDAPAEDAPAEDATAKNAKAKDATAKATTKDATATDVSAKGATNPRLAYYLVTKPRYFDKPTYATLSSSLAAMFSDMMTRGINRIAMPELGCGLDLLEWPKVRDLVCNQIDGKGIEVTVYHYKPAVKLHARNGNFAAKK